MVSLRYPGAGQLDSESPLSYVLVPFATLCAERALPTDLK